MLASTSAIYRIVKRLCYLQRVMDSRSGQGLHIFRLYRNIEIYANPRYFPSRMRPAGNLDAQSKNFTERLSQKLSCEVRS